MNPTLLALALLLAVTFAQCPPNYAIPNLLAGTPHPIKIPCNSQSPSLPRSTPPKPPSTPLAPPSPPPLWSP